MALTEPDLRPLAYSIKRHGHTLTRCDDEPVHTPGCIQAHGLMLALQTDTLVVSQVSDNCSRWLDRSPAQILGQPLGKVIGAELAQRVDTLARHGDIDNNPCFVTTAVPPHSPPGLGPQDLTLHRADGVLVLELEPASRLAPDPRHHGDPFATLRRAIGRLKGASTLTAFCEVAAHEARALTGLDRAMVYRFHADHSGEVMADAHRSDLPSWLGLRFPAEDIPLPAREIFRRIGVRPLPDARGELSEMVPLLNPDTGRPLEMTHCALRGASVMYTEYLQNMGVAASLTMPILHDGALWGLIACHHQSAVAMPYPMRSGAEFLAQVASLELAQLQAREDLRYRIHLDTVHLAVLARAAANGQLTLDADPAPGLVDGIDADGVALFQHGQWLTAGTCPAPDRLPALALWLRQRIAANGDGPQVYATDALGSDWPQAADWPDSASGVLATAVSSHPGSVLMLWFRGEQVQTFNWAGNPHQVPGPVGPLGTRLTPRRSFELWQEQVRGRSRPWRTTEIDGAVRLRRMVMDLVILRAERMTETHTELLRSNSELDTFAYVVGHDLKEPLRGINKYAQRLLDDAGAGREVDVERLAWLLRTTERMDALLDALLHYSQVGRLTLTFDDTDLNGLLVEANEMLGARLVDSAVTLRVPRRLPVVRCDRARVREILSNLISNAAKYTDKTPAWVEVGWIGEHDADDAEPRPASTPPAAREHTLFYVRDNGIGIEARHHERVFAIFKRLHASDAYGGGSGAGLTIVRKMVEQHNGLIWLDSVPGQGSTFYFTLPGAGDASRGHHGA